MGRLLPWGMLLACQVADAPALGECGNGIIEPGAREDCEPVANPQGCGGVGTGASACRFICEPGDCPEGFRCGLDGICRQPCVGHEGEPQCRPFEMLSTDVTTAEIAQLQLLDVAGDERPEIFAVEVDAAGAGARLSRYDGTVFLPGANALPLGGFPLLTRLTAGGPWYAMTSRLPLPAAPTDDPAFRQAIIAEVDPDLGFREALIQGPQTVDPGPLRLASYATPPDLPDGHAAQYLFGFRDGALWDPGGTLALPASGHPDDLVGPVVGQPIAASTDAEASRWCDVIVWGYRGDDILLANNPCDAVPGWSSAPLQIPALPAPPWDGLAFADANADGLDDLVVSTEAGRIHVAVAIGDGAFADFDDGIAGDGVIGVADFNADGQPDFITRSSWIRSCSIEGCGTCDVPGYRCDEAPPLSATAASLVDLDGDGIRELAVIAAEASDDWGPAQPEAGDLVIIEHPATPTWSARVVPLPGTPALLDSGDIDGDARDDLVLVDESHGLVVVYGGDEATETVDDFETVVDAHVQAGSPTLAVVSEDAEGGHRRLTLLSAAAGRQLRSTTKLELDVVPRAFVAGRFDATDPDARAVAIAGERSGTTAVELLTRGEGDFFDASTRLAATTDLGAAIDRVHGVAVDLDGDGVDELVLFGADGFVRTLRVSDDALVLVAADAVAESYGAPTWPRGADGSAVGSRPRRRDLDGDGDVDLWMLTADDPPRLVTFRNRGDGTLDVAGRVLIPVPAAELSTCDVGPTACAVRMTSFAPFSGTSDRSLAIAPTALDIVLVSHRALWHWTLDPFDPASATALDEVAVVQGMREALGAPRTQAHVELGDIEGDGVDDVVAAGQTGIRWLRGLAVNP